MQPDGKLIEGAGINPDVTIKTAERQFREGDPVLDTALRLIRKSSKPHGAKPDTAGE